MIQLLPHKDIYAIATPLVMYNPTITSKEDLSILNYWRTDFNPATTEIQLPPGKWLILGEVTKDAISFDVKGFIHKFNNGAYRDYSCESFAPDNDSLPFCLTSNESFYSLLEANGLCFVNPMPYPGKNVDGDNVDIHIEWQSFEDKLVQKALIIQNTTPNK